MPKKYNNLKNESSSYLKQHSRNPVDWYPWRKKALLKAKSENKIIILSIGYSTCHWCHVMERECFENKEIAHFMNRYFISIKVDREERPDIDNLYMEAIQYMGLQGGWPLNVFLMPNKKPFYGGTYFTPNNWLAILKNIVDISEKNKNEIIKSSNIFTNDLKKSHEEKFKNNNEHYIKKLVNEIKIKFDYDFGGMMRSPKFPMPTLWNSLLFYSIKNNDKEIFNHVQKTVDSIIKGGIYDQIRGGFSRYSTDQKWTIPHFEKMIYDNGQLLELLSNLYKITHQDRYKEVIKDTVDWLSEEMRNDNGGFYSAVDADSDNEEGKFYVWNIHEIKEVLGKDYKIAKNLYKINEEGNWDGKIILLRNLKHKISSKKIKSLKNSLLNHRNKRKKPFIDKKIISSWNGIVLIGLLNCYQSTKIKKYLDLAKSNAIFIKEKLIIKNKIKRVFESNINGFLDDYAFIINAFIKYYETTQDFTFLNISRNLMEYTIKHFYSKKDKMFFYNGSYNEKLLTKKIQIFDDVIPSSNSIMYYNLLYLGKIYNDSLYNNIYNDMSQKLKKYLSNYEFMANWIYVNELNESKINEIVMNDSKYDESITQEINSWYLPNKILVYNSKNLKLEILNSHKVGKKLSFSLCRNNVCEQPYDSINKLKKAIYK